MHRLSILEPPRLWYRSPQNRLHVPRTGARLRPDKSFVSRASDKAGGIDGSVAMQLRSASVAEDATLKRFDVSWACKSV